MHAGFIALNWRLHNQLQL